MGIIYLTLDQAIDTHRKTIEVSGGGLLGARDVGQLESMLQHIQNDEYYPTFHIKITHLFYSLCKFHAFLDGNKRIAISLTAQMLLLNGYLFCITDYMRRMENISFHVASGKIDKQLLLEIITVVLQMDEETEELQLKIIHALNS